MSQFPTHYIALISCLLLLAPTSQASSQEQTKRPQYQTTGYLYGGGLNLGESVYKDDDTSIMALPLLGYRGEKLNVFGPFVSYDFAQKGPLTLFAQVSPRFQSFEESDSPVFQGMAQRKKTIEAGFGYKLKLDQWQLRGSALGELFGVSNGTELKTTLTRQFRKGPFTMTPSASVSYLSNDHVHYFYGVRANEATVERPQYQGTKTLNQSIGVTFATPIFFEGMTRLSLTNTWLGTEIRNSPLVDKPRSLQMMLMFTRFF